MAVKKTVHTAEEILTVLEELKKQTDRGAAIVAASVAEELLAVVIQERLLPLNSEIRKSLFDRPNAPLSSFSAKIDLGYALGLFSDSAMKHLHILRECRNRFAHRIEPLNFDHPSITEVLSKIGESELRNVAKTNRDLYEGLFRTIAIILIAECNQDIRIEDLGKTRPDIFIRLVGMLWPEKAGVLENFLRQMAEGH